MNVSYRRWKGLFICCFGIALGSALCMKWIETEFLVGDEKFTMLGLELFYSKERVVAILSNINDHVATILDYHLHFDFVFMAGIFPGISALCMMAREKVRSPGLKKLLFIMAILQLAAWAGDVAEDLYLLKWLKTPQIGSEFSQYHLIVATKWIIALTGFMLGAIVFLTARLKRSQK